MRDDVAAMNAGARAHVHQVIGFEHRVAIVLYHQYRIAEFLEPLERAEQALVIALMKSDRGLVENVEDAHEARPDLRREPDALALAAGKTARSAVES